MMNRMAKLSGTLAALGMATGLLLTPGTASADTRTTLSAPVVLRFEDGTALSRNTWGTTYFAAKWATTLSAGNWSGYVQFSDGTKAYFCDLETLQVHNKPSTALFVSRLKATWCR
jgi:hypothetical protein